MAFWIRFRCTNCGYERHLDVDDAELKVIRCPAMGCKHYAKLSELEPSRYEDVMDEDELEADSKPPVRDLFVRQLRQDRKSIIILQVVTAIVLLAALVGFGVGVATMWPKLADDGVSSSDAGDAATSEMATAELKEGEAPEASDATVGGFAIAIICGIGLLVLGHKLGARTLACEF